MASRRQVSQHIAPGHQSGHRLPTAWQWATNYDFNCAESADLQSVVKMVGKRVAVRMRRLASQRSERSYLFPLFHIEITPVIAMPTPGSVFSRITLDNNISDCHTNYARRTNTLATQLHVRKLDEGIRIWY